MNDVPGTTTGPDAVLAAASMPGALLPQSELRTSPEIDQLATALSDMQGDLTNPDPKKTVTVRTKAGPAYKFKYAPLDEVLKIVRPALAAQQLSLIQIPTETDKGTVLISRLMHSSGQWMESTVRLGSVENMKGFGAAITYVRRYVICALVGIFAEDDKDSAVADGDKIIKDNDGSLWIGPLQPTKLKAALRKLTKEIQACSDQDELNSLLYTEPARGIIDQCQVDLPSWWSGAAGTDVKGIEDYILEKGAEFASDYADGPAGDEPPPNDGELI